MTTSSANRVRGVLGVGLFVLLGGCQTFSGWMSSSKPAAPAPNNSAIATDTAPQKPITKEQKLEVEMAMARAAANDGHTEQAIQIYEDVIKKNSGHAEAYHRLAIVYDLKGEPQKARKNYMTAIQKAPKNAELYCDFGYSCYLQRNWAEATANLRLALELRPEFARAHNNLGLVLAHTYHESEALAEFSKAGCDEASARSNLAFVLTVEERWPEARQQYELALAADPHAAAAKKGLAALDAHAPEGGVGPARMAASLAPPPAAPPAVGPAPLGPPPVSPPAAPIAASLAAPPALVSAPVVSAPVAPHIVVPLPPPPPAAPRATLPEGDLARVLVPGNATPPPRTVQTSLVAPDTDRF